MLPIGISHQYFLVGLIQWPPNIGPGTPSSLITLAVYCAYYILHTDVGKICFWPSLGTLPESHILTRPSVAEAPSCPLEIPAPIPMVSRDYILSNGQWNLGGCDISPVQLLSCVGLFATPWTAARQASLSITNSSSLFNSCPLSWWCHPTISSSVLPFSSHLQSFPTSGSFPMGQFLASGGQSIGVSASGSDICWFQT